MPVTAELREQGHVWYYVITDPWETSDLISFYKQDFAHRETVNHTVHLVMNVSAMHSVPINLLRARNNAPAWSHRTSGQLVMVGAHSFAKSIAEMIFKLAHYEKAKFFNSEAEGWDYIRAVIAEEPSEMVTKA